MNLGILAAVTEFAVVPCAVIDLISAETVIDLMLATAAAGSRWIRLDVTAVIRARTVAGELLRVIGSHLADRGVEVVLEGELG